MFYLKYVWSLTFLHFTYATLKFNLYYTDSISNTSLQYNCLRIVTSTRGRNTNNQQKFRLNPETDTINLEIMSYCMNEFSPSFHIEEKTDDDKKFTFYDLSKKNITSEQLYLWSAPIDLIEKYQSYLNKQSEANEIFYNCTLPRFGLQCQYEFISSHSNYSSIHELIHKYYTTNIYNSASLTCYKHLECYHGSNLVCLDWIDICNGHIDCIDNGIDEEYCWQLVINPCNENEFQCHNGQCIPKIFYQDDKNIFDCVDASDEILSYRNLPNLCHTREPTFGCEDRICKEGLSTSSCVNKRKPLPMNTIFSIRDNSTSDDCWFAIRCMFDRLYSKELFCQKVYAERTHRNTLLDTCPEILFVPNYPILFGDTYIIMYKNQLKELSNDSFLSPYIFSNSSFRYDSSLNILSEIHFKSNPFEISTGNTDSELIIQYYQYLDDVYGNLKRHRLYLDCASINCNRSHIYQCTNSSKYILLHRLFDINVDCPHKDDENMSIMKTNPNLKEQLQKSHFYCHAGNKYLSPGLINNNICDCPDNVLGLCVDENVGDEDITREILFPTVCDGFQELLPILIENQNHTDETECQQWECDNVYTHCDGVWNCDNGADETGCDQISRLMCSINQHLCVSISTYKLTCVDLSRINDGKLDCIGGTDEPRRTMHLPQPSGLKRYAYIFTCMNHTVSPDLLPFMLCNGHTVCKYEDDEKFCDTDQTNFAHRGICLSNNIYYGSHAEKFLCGFVTIKYKRAYIFFKLDNVINLPKRISEDSIDHSSLASQLKFHCHRGLNLRVWPNNDRICLCPPSYYGDDCQYQNQRISLVIKFRALSDSWRIEFAIIISLIDNSDDRIVHSYERITYLSLKDCKTKFHFYLLYSTRPKDSMKNYSIHIDFYERKTLNHRGSLLYPILFPFLPVYRLALIVDIPPASNIQSQICSKNQCKHGKCIKYVNNLDFCQCKEGWYGRDCTKRYIHTCSSDSLSIGISANQRSICVCPPNKFGPRCLLSINTMCQSNHQTTCQHGGQCVPTNPEMISNQEFTCVCESNYSGDRCETIDTVISLSFHTDILLSHELYIHFIRIMNNLTHQRSTTARSLTVKEDLINITWPQPFHIVFIDISNKSYYLVAVENIYIPSRNINKMIKSSDRCLHINEFSLNKTLVQWHIRRVKYYHLLCQNQSVNFPCFYDDLQICLCYQYGGKRLANCFNFDHNMTFNCEGQSECENHGKCFEDQSECPTTSICLCPPCYFGQRCQLTTKGSGLSLDVILGYQILPNLNINNQPFIIKLNYALAIIFLILGFLNGILSLMTFLNKTICKVGCGLYLLTLSIISLLITIFFGLKFFILLYSHMSILRNETFLRHQCYIFDFSLRLFLSISQWLNACIAIERTITVINGVNFDKEKSKKTAQIIIISLFIITGSSCIHDLIYRELITEIKSDDTRLNQFWCVVRYSSKLEIYNSLIHTFHIIGPFIINLASVVILILKKTRQESNLHKQQSYKLILRKTIKEHRNLLTAPIVLVILGIPRIILIFVSKCMKSSNDAWLFLTGYFISLIPPMLIFLIFILPSTFYKEIFYKTFKPHIFNILRWFGLIQ
ncbi:unnamed protein product [Adineta ricciae]|uniref:Uncharacterized protein n=1 Tax=Adineta ricciae TaxID=249248 RepID=A0A815KW03_ADIRI|nr:unnamed protein product [Adineta ricciae]CAF1528194.1 unnamed protein product [Adineta ricciae]